MIPIRLILPLKFDHFEIPAGTVIAVPVDIAQSAVARGIGVRTEAERAVLEQQEVRTVQRGRPRREA